MVRHMIGAPYDWCTLLYDIPYEVHILIHYFYVFYIWVFVFVFLYWKKSFAILKFMVTRILCLCVSSALPDCPVLTVAHVVVVFVLYCVITLTRTVD